MRLGSPRFDTNETYDANKPSLLISPRDTAQLFQKCVDVENTPFAIVHGVSNNKVNWMGLEETSQILGYHPQDGTALQT